MGLRKRCFLFNYLFINMVQESDFEFEISEWQLWKYFKWKMGMCLLPEWISMQWVISVKCIEDYVGILMCMGTNENSSYVQNLKLHFFLPLITFHFVLQAACSVSCVQKLCEIPIRICHDNGFDASNCTDFDSYSLCCLLKSWLWLQSTILYILAQKRAQIIICLRLLYCARVANTSVLQKLTAHE
jgi:hypothetical protein